MKRIVGLDTLRFFAVAIILVYHLLPAYVPLPGGFIGVDLFFCLSGFLITSLILKRKRGGKSGDRIANYAPFIWRRIKRLLPPLVITVLLTLNLLLLVPNDISTQLGLKTLGALSFSTNIIEIITGNTYEASIIPNVFEHTWSLGVEMQFYLIWPLILIALAAVFKKKNQKYAAVVILSALLAVSSAALMYQFAVNYDMPNRAYFGLDTHASGLMLGSLLAAMYTWKSTQKKKQKTLAQRKLVALLLTIALIVTILILIAVYMSFDDYWAFRLGLALTAVLGTLLILCILLLEPWLYKHPPKITEYLGKLAYGIYLFHWPLFIILPFLLPQPFSNEVMLTLVAVLSVGLAVLCHEILENGRWLAWLRRKSALPAVAISFVLLMSLPTPIEVLQAAPARSSIEIMLEEQENQAKYEAAEAAQLAIDDHRLAVALIAEAEFKRKAEEAAAEAAREYARLHPPTPSLAGVNVLVLGDSVTLGARSTLKGTVPNVFVDAVGSRNILAAPGLIRSYLANGFLPPKIVISLITNVTAWGAGDLDNILNAAGEGHSFLLVTGWCGPNYPRTEQNERLRAYAASHSNVGLADWWAIAKDHPEYMYDDGIHLTPEGASAYASLIAEALNSL